MNSTNRYRLDGCATSPFSKYLKALGVFRIIAQQKDSNVRGFWRNEKFVIETVMSREELVDFLLDKYTPSPVVGPWSYIKYGKTLIHLKPLIKSPRFAVYLKTIHAVKRVIQEYCSTCGITQAEVDKSIRNKATKPLFLRMCRNSLPDEAVLWLDTVFVLVKDGVKFAPVLGSGGNDGNFDIPENFVRNLNLVLAGKREHSKCLLESALFGDAVNLVLGSTFGHNPDGIGGPNFGKSLSNPWEYILMVEGSMLFAGNIARRQSATSTGKAIFPFTTNAANVGYATASDGEEGRGEIWLPVWSASASYGEIRHVFNEGRVQLNGRQAKTGIEFARAIASYGTERGVSAFQQFCILQRNGKNYITASAGRMRVSNEPAAHLISDIDMWYNQVVQQSTKKGAPASLNRLVRDMDKAILQLCKYRKKSDMLNMLICIGKISRYVSNRGTVNILDSLSNEWLVESYDGTAEFRLAASVASIKSSGKVEAIRSNLENIVRKQGKWVSHRSPSCVWNELDDLPRNLTNVLQRRAIDGIIDSQDTIPIRAAIPARTDDIAAFLNGELDMSKMSLLIPSLSLVSIDGETYPWKNVAGGDSLPLPEAYTVIKLLYPPDNDDDILFDMSVLNLLKAGRVNKAYEKASQTLYSHGHQPFRYSRYTGSAHTTTLSATAQPKLLASLLFPLSKSDRQRLAKQVVKQVASTLHNF